MAEKSKGKAVLIGVFTALAVTAGGFVFVMNNTDVGEHITKLIQHFRSANSSASENAPFSDEATGIRINYAEKDTEDIIEPEEDSDTLANVDIPFATEYFLQFLTEDEKTVCRQIYRGLQNFDEVISIRKKVVKSEDICQFIVLCTSCAPELNYIGQEYSVSVDPDGYVMSIDVEYVKTPEEAQTELNEINARIDEIMSGFSPEWGDFEKLEYFHDVIITSCSYDETGENCYTAYGCIVDGKAVCEGYTKALLMFCERADIGCIPVVGQGIEGDEMLPHIWNKVLIDGNWYGMDITWDDPVSQMGDGYLRYDYFAVTDEEMNRDHSADENKYLRYPEAVSADSNYFIRKGLLVSHSDFSEDIIRTALCNAMADNKDYARIKCSDSYCYANTYEKLFVQQTETGNPAIFGILNDCAQQYPEGRYDSMSYSIIKNDKMNTITVKLNRIQPEG